MKADGSVIIDTKVIEGGLKKGFDLLKNQMSSVGVSIEELGDKIKLAFSDKATVPIENAVLKVKELEQKLFEVTDELSVARANREESAAERAYKRQKVVYDQLEKARRRLAQVIIQEASKEDKAEKRAAQKVLREKERAYKKATKSAKAFGKRLTSIMASALVFNVISKGLREITQYFGKALKSNEKFSDSWNTLKGSVLTAIQPIYEILLPALTTAVNVAAKLARMIGNVFASLSSKSADQIKENAEALYEQAKATEENGTAAENAKKQLAGFDDLNVLGSDSSADSGSSSPNFEFQDIDINSKLSEMATLVAEAVFALGIILTLSGASIPLGLGMIVFGGMLMYESIKENWGGVGSDVLSTAEAIAFLASTVLLAIGIIVTFCCPSHLGLGIGLIIAGVAGMATTVATNWNAIKEALQSPLGATVALIAGAVFIVLGILCCVAGVWALGIGLIIAGAASVVATVAVNWNAITDAMQGPIGKMVALASGALLVIGVILLCCGVITPLTIGMVVAGAAGMVTAVAFNWNAIVDWIKTAWNKVKEFWNRNIAPVFTGKFWSDLAEKCGNGLIAGFEKAINGLILLVESMVNGIIKALNKISIDIPDWLGGGKFGFNIPEAKFERVSIPRLAQGAVIPPNREFMAVLGDQKHGTNIEAPLETIKQALAEVLAMQDGGSETNVNVTFTGDLAQLARVLKPAIETETRRRGGSLAKGAVY